MVNGKQQYWFVCLLGKCYQEGTDIKIQKHSTCNGTSHLLAKHAIQSSKTTAHKRNAATLCKHIEGADDLFQANPARWFEVNIASKLPVVQANAIKTMNMRKHYVKHYVTSRNT
jgi:hypothetical protein